MIEFSFTFVITKPTMDEVTAANILYSHIDDGILSVCEDRYTIEFDRVSHSMKEAIDSAMLDVEQSGINTKVVGIIFN